VAGKSKEGELSRLSGEKDTRKSPMSETGKPVRPEYAKKGRETYSDKNPNQGRKKLQHRRGGEKTNCVDLALWALGSSRRGPL